VRKYLFALLAVLGLTLAVAPAATAAPSGPVTAGCGTRQGPDLQAQPAGSWNQKTIATICDYSPGIKRITATLRFTPRAGFVGGNVVECVAYLTIYHLGGTANTQPASCLQVAKNGGGQSDPVHWDVGINGSYRVTGYAVVTTAVKPYSGADSKSDTGFFAI
jgi:hypothetical protein